MSGSTASAIVGELDMVRARRTELDRKALFRDLTAAEDREWQALDEREAALTADLRQWVFVTTGMNAARLAGALA